MEFCIDSAELRKALEKIEAAEERGFYHCLAVFCFSHAGHMLDENRAVYVDLCERAGSPTGSQFDWGRGQGITRRFRFVDGKLVADTTP